MPSPDFQLLSGLFSRIVDKEEIEGINCLTEPEQVILLIWHASGIIGNGGFQYFFEQELDAEAVAAAYEKIGSNKCAEILRLALSLLPDSIKTAGWTERIEFIEEKKDMFYNTSCLFWDANEQVEQRLAEYVKANLDSILK